MIEHFRGENSNHNSADNDKNKTGRIATRTLKAVSTDRLSLHMCRSLLLHLLPMCNVMLISRRSLAHTKSLFHVHPVIQSLSARHSSTELCGNRKRCLCVRTLSMVPPRRKKKFNAYTCFSKFLSF